MKVFNILVISLMLVISSAAVLAENGESYIYNYEFLSHFDRVNSKSPNADNYDPVSGMVSFTATDIDIPGNSKLKVQLRRILNIGSPTTSQSTGEFGYYTRSLGGRNLPYVSNWSLDIPHITGYLLDGDWPAENTKAGWLNNQDNWFNGNECSGSYTDGIPGDSQETYVKGYEYWNGIKLHVPGETTDFLILADQSNPGYSSDMRTTNSNWVSYKSECYRRDDATSGANGGFLIHAPDGRKFYFDVVKDFWVGSDKPIKYPFEKIRRVIFVSKIEDKFGNYVEYNYSSDSQLESIVASDGRRIDLVYNEGHNLTSAYIKDNKSTPVTTRTWTYESTGNGRLEKVTLPNGDTWNYSNSDFLANSRQYNSISDGSVAGNCEVPEDNPIQTFTITDPDYLVTTYSFKRVRMARYGVDTDAYRINQELEYRSLNCTINLTLIKKEIMGQSLPKVTEPGALVWQYDYSENAGTYSMVDHTGIVNTTAYDNHVGDSINIPYQSNIPSVVTSLGTDSRAKVRTTTVTSPTEKMVYYINRTALDEGRLYDIAEQQVISVDTYDLVSNKLLKRVESTFESGFQVRDSLHDGDHNAGAPSGVNQQTLNFRVNLVENKITLYSLDGSDDTYTTKFSYDDFFGLSTGTEAYRSSSQKQYTKQTYLHDTNHWHLNLPEKTSTSNDGTNYQVTNATKYQTLRYPSSGKPLMPKYIYLGDFTTDYIKSYNFSDDGNLSSITFNEFKSNADGTISGSKRSQGFSNYHRGIPQTVTMSNRYNTSTQTLTSEVDDFGQVTKYTDLDGKVTNYSFDDIGRIATVDYMDTLVADIKFTWGSAGYLGSKRDVFRCVLDTSENCIEVLTQQTTTYDGLLRPIIIKNQETKTGSYNYINWKYNANGQVVFESYPTTYGSSTYGTNTQYDALQRPISTSSYYRGTQTIEHLSVNRKKVTDELGNETTTWYRAFGEPDYSQPIAINSPEGVGTAFEYDLFDNPIHIWQQGPGTPSTTSQHQYNAYDSYRRLCKVSRDDIGVTVYDYNTIGELKSKTEGISNNTPTDCSGSDANQKTSYTYDNLGSPWKVTYPGETADKVYTNSPHGDLLQLTAGYVTQTYTYTGNHWLDTEKIELDSNSWVFDYGRNELGHMTSLKYPNNHLINYNPNGFGQAAEATRSGFNYAVDASYYPNGTLSSFTYGNGLLHKTYLGANKVPSQVIDYRTDFTAVNKSYNYYDNLSLQSITDNVNAAYSITNMTYDGLDRLKTVTAGSGIGNSSINYDALGNITYYESKGRALNYTYNSKNQISKVDDTVGDKDYYMFPHDQRGNIVYNGKRSFKYDLNNLIIESGSNRYIYDGFNRRIKTTDSKGTTYTLYNSAGTLLFRQNNNKSVNHVYLGGKLIAKDGEGDTASPSGLTHSRPFGESIETSKDGVGYTGHVYDTDLGLNYMQARYYDPVIGRFYSNDPVGFTGGIDTFNRYSYVANNPYKYTDPTGEAKYKGQKSGLASANLIARGVAAITEEGSGLNNFADAVVEATDAAISGKKPTKAGAMQQKKERGQVNKKAKIDRFDKADDKQPNSKDHVHFDDGTSMNNDGTSHDKGKGTPKPNKAARKVLKDNNWADKPKEEK